MHSLSSLNRYQFYSKVFDSIFNLCISSLKAHTADTELLHYASYPPSVMVPGIYGLGDSWITIDASFHHGHHGQLQLSQLQDNICRTWHQARNGSWIRAAYRQAKFLDLWLREKHLQRETVADSTAQKAPFSIRFSMLPAIQGDC